MRHTSAAVKSPQERLFMYDTNHNLTLWHSKPALQVCMAIALAGSVTGCQLLPSAKPWNYKNTPNIDDQVVFPGDAVVCSSLGGAQFMAATGFYAPDCSSELPDAGNAQVQQVVEFNLNGVAMNIVITSIESQTYWIPLPNHNWY